jgi:predicted nucleic-acid-binding Zn-ribbon protein
MSGHSYDTECPNCGNENYLIQKVHFVWIVVFKLILMFRLQVWKK